MEYDLPKALDLGKLESRNQLAIFLIKAELKNVKFARDLEQVGFDASDVTYDLGSLILDLAGFEQRSDELYEWYYKKLEEYSGKMIRKEEPCKLTGLAVQFFDELKEENHNAGKLKRS